MREILVLRYRGDAVLPEGGGGVIIFNLCKKIIQWSDYLRKDFSFVPCNGSIYVLSWKPGQAFLFTLYKVVISVCLEV